MTIYVLRWLGKVIPGTFRVFFGFFRLIFKKPIYTVLTKIYYKIFQFRKTRLDSDSHHNLNFKNLGYVLIIGLSLILFFYNTQQSTATNRQSKLPKTVLAKIIPAEFGLPPDEELIQERAPNNFIAYKQNYIEEDYSLQSQAGLEHEQESSQNNLPIFDELGDTIFKPLNNVNNTGQLNGQAEPVQERQTIINYIVQNGDTVSSIARRFGLSVNTVLWSNNLSAYSLIRPGNELTILPYNGITYTVKSGDTISKIAARYEVTGEKIKAANGTSDDLKIGQQLIIPGAKKITEQIAASTPRNTYTSGLSVIKNLIKSPAVKSTGAKMAWPTSGNRLSQYFSWRHNGVDIANKVGTPIYAAEAGVVEVAASGWNGGYGNTILINHGGGKKTRYGHLSKLFVSAGDEVERGENIGAMGSTGRSTGSHLHFEVMINKTRYNPLNYIK